MSVLRWLGHEFLHFTGSSNTSGTWYGFFSGFGSGGPWLIMAATMLHHVNCDVKGCPRPGPHKYDKDGHTHKVCKRHHPALGKGHRLSHQDLLDHHGQK